MKKYAVMAMFLVAMLFSSKVIAGTMYSVEAGDTFYEIAQKNGVTRSALQEANPQIKNVNRILIGQSINLPEKGVRIIRPVVIKKSVQQLARPWNPGSNPWRLGKAEGIKRLHYSPSGESELSNAVRKNNHFSSAYIYKNGKVVDDFGNEYTMVLMGFGKGDFFQPIPAWKDSEHIEGGWIYKSETGEYAMFPFKCQNPTRIVLIAPRKIPSPVPIAPAPTLSVPDEQSQDELPPIFKEVAVEKTRGVYNHELDLGGGIWTNQDNSAHGEWWFAQYKLFLEKYNTGFAGGTLTPVVGIFGKGDLGKTDAGYDWNNWGVGPQVGAMWNGTTAKGYPQQIQFMIRAIYFHMNGQNGWSGYSKEQEHILVGYYLEYIRRIHPEYMTILYAEGWFDINKTLNSTWSGDKATDLTQFVIGAKLHKDLTESWAVRFGFQLGYQLDENRFGANAHIEMRYNDWLIFGPSVDYCIDSNIAAEISGWAFGGLVRGEFNKQVEEGYTEYELRQVKPSSEQILKY